MNASTIFTTSKEGFTASADWSRIGKLKLTLQPQSGSFVFTVLLNVTSLLAKNNKNNSVVKFRIMCRQGRSKPSPIGMGWTNVNSHGCFSMNAMQNYIDAEGAKIWIEWQSDEEVLIAPALDEDSSSVILTAIFTL